MIKRLAWRQLLIGMVLTLLVIGAVLLGIVLTGAYNVAADDRHTPTTEWALETTMRNSVQGRAEDLEAPTLTMAMVSAGAGEYKAMCQHCHGGVGEPRAGWAQGMRPIPPSLVDAAKEWSTEEVFWLVKHGVKMSGMPAFGDTHDDRTNWNIAAFVKAMPEMSAEEYVAYGAEGHGDEGAHEHGSSEASGHTH